MNSFFSIKNNHSADSENCLGFGAVNYGPVIHLVSTFTRQSKATLKDRYLVFEIKELSVLREALALDLFPL